MDRTRTVHECLFCPQTFDSAVDKDDHILCHFVQEICAECNRNLIRIGTNLYTLHTKETCVENKLPHHVKTESPIEIEVSDDIEMQNEHYVSDSDFNTINRISGPAAIHVEDVDIKIELEPNNTQDDESQIKIEKQFVAIDNENLPDHNEDNNENNLCLDNLSMDPNSEESQSQLYVDSLQDKRRKISRRREKCDVCFKTYYVGTLKRHKINQHNFCNVCTKTFSDKMEFDLHKPHCTKVKKPGRNTHCGICNLTLKTRKTYLAHMRTIHHPMGKPHKCDRCGSQFRDTSGLKAHTCRPDKDQQPRVFIDPKIHIIDGRYVCDVCNVSLKTRTSLRMHKIFIHKELGDIVCRLCARAFPTVDELSKHQIECQLKKQDKSWGGFSSFQCDICSATFRSKDGIRQHIQHTHLKTAKRFKCEQCHLAFYSKSEVKLHNKIVHLNIRDFICTACGKAFKLKYQLKNHAYVHSREKFKCFQEDCDKYFSSPMSRKKHMDTHREAHGNPQEGRVKCELCGLSFASKTTLRNHHRFMHLNIRNFKCMICDEAFKSKNALQMHTYKHTGEKPFSCPHSGCERKFRSQSNRDEHYRSHTGEKPFLCSFEGCSQRFRFSVDFRRHKLNVHGITSNKSFPCTICGENLSKNSLLTKHMRQHTECN